MRIDFGAFLAERFNLDFHRRQFLSQFTIRLRLSDLGEVDSAVFGISPLNATQTTSVIDLPSQKWIGRPSDVVNTVSLGIPINWYRVAATSSVKYWSRTQTPPSASVAPTTTPGLMPAPAKITLPTEAQWSRPAPPLICGVRPKSPIQTTRVDSRRPLSCKSCRRAGMAWSKGGSLLVLRMLKLLSWVSQPPSLTVTKRTPASISAGPADRIDPAKFGHRRRAHGQSPC